MPEIRTDGPHITFINVFTVRDPSRQKEVLDIVRAVGEVAVGMPGFVSSSLHASEDGTRVVNYVQWRERADLERLFATPEFRRITARFRGLADFDPRVYRVESVFEPPAP